MKMGIISEKDRIADREEFLRNLLEQYYNLIRQGESKAKAAKKLGYLYTNMTKKEIELKRIETEKRNMRKEIKVPYTPTIDLEKLKQKDEKIIREKGEI